MNALRFILCSGILLLGSNVSHAGFTFLGPTPYLSAADSPFNLSGLGTTFFLEDFEDIEVNTPGLIVLNNGGIGLGSSVDADDGAIDGSGNGGHFLSAAATSCTTLECGVLIDFQFDNFVLGFYPSRVGFVITSTFSQGLLRAYDSQGSVEEFSFSLTGFDSAQVADDRFFGFINPHGISAIWVASLERKLPPKTPLQIDHIQYGVPEPGSLTSFLMFLGIATRKPHRWLR